MKKSVYNKTFYTLPALSDSTFQQLEHYKSATVYSSVIVNMRHVKMILVLFSLAKFVASFISHSRPMNIFNPISRTLLNAKVTPNQGESMDEYRKVYAKNSHLLFLLRS